MDIAAIFADVKLAVKLAKMAYDLKQDSGPYLSTAYAISFEHKSLTADERQAMIDQELAFRADVDKVTAEDDAATD